MLDDQNATIRNLKLNLENKVLFLKEILSDYHTDSRFSRISERIRRMSKGAGL